MYEKDTMTGLQITDVRNLVQADLLSQDTALIKTETDLVTDSSKKATDYAVANEKDSETHTEAELLPVVHYTTIQNTRTL